MANIALEYFCPYYSVLPTLYIIPISTNLEALTINSQQQSNKIRRKKGR